VDNLDHARSVIIVGMMVVLGRMMWMTWLTEDAFISLRMVRNLLEGQGFVWNLGERVLVTTNPLWSLLMAGCIRLTGEVCWTVVALCMVCSASAVGVLALRVAPSPQAAIAPLLALLGARYYAHYSTSGLENPLVHLLVVAFMAIYVRGAFMPRRIGVMSVLFGLTLMCRPDALLLLAPMMLAGLWWAPTGHRRAAVEATIIGALPLLLWAGWATYYYGSPIPNTALAKLNHGVPRAALIPQGFTFLRMSFLSDPVMALGVLGVPVLALTDRVPRALPAVAGIGLCLAYQVQIGGGYMAGRFLTPLLAVGLALLAITPSATPTSLRRIDASWSVSGMIVLAGVVVPLWKTVGAGPFGEDPRQKRDKIIDMWFHRPEQTQLRPSTFSTFTLEPYPADVAERVARGARRVRHGGAIGLKAYTQDPTAYIVDFFALSDPLLARMPALAEGWAPGHFARAIPAGYLDSLQARENQIVDPDIAALYDSGFAVSEMVSDLSEIGVV